MEFLDVINSQDEVIGREERNIVHERHLLHRSAHIIIIDKKKRILLQLRKATKKQYLSFWSSSAAGHVPSGSSVSESAQREMKEEIGIATDLQFVGKFFVNDDVEHELSSLFLGRSDGPFKLQEEEMEKAEFFTLEELKEGKMKLTPHLKMAIGLIAPLL